jgi:hypothetical protein
MRISSLFKDKAYAFQDQINPDDDNKFALEILKKFKPRLKPKNIRLLSIHDDFDFFLLENEKNENLSLKISLSDEDGVLKKEVTALKSCKCDRVPNFVDYGEVKMGETITCLLSKVPPAESIRSQGRGIIFEDIEDFRDAYCKVFDEKRVKNTYKNVISNFTKHIDPSSFLPSSSLKAFKSYTDYNRCSELLSELERDMLTRIRNVEGNFKFKCHSSISLDSVFYGSCGFYFDFLSNVCMGHPFLDLSDLILEIGLKTHDDKRFILMFCDLLSIPFDENLFNEIYHLQLRKKLTELLTNYIKEIYLYDAFRYEKIFYIADTFSHAYDRFCSIPAFKENRDFIMKTICEPIFGVKA